MSRPCRIAVSCGEPAGIGPEVTWLALRALAAADLSFLLVGPRSVWERSFAVCGGSGPLPHPILEPPDADPGDWSWGAPTPATGRAALAAVETAAALVFNAEADALVTAPLTKSGLQAAGSPHPGHTELLGARFGRKPLMMFDGGDLRVVLLTTHLPLREVPRHVTPEAVAATLVTMGRALTMDFGLDAPRIAVCGLNPHAGEGGVLGEEDAHRIAPGIETARAAGVDAAGPIPADSAFHEAKLGVYDAVLAMYHDQGLAPFKLLHFHDGVNVTLNLPIVRTSPDHGTAFALAGRAVADPSSMTAAIRLAAEIVRRRKGAAA